MEEGSSDEISALLARIRRIELRTRGLVRESIGGAYESCFKGQGVDFEDLREYQHGDDVRTIDWNVTARMGEAYVKQFREERELTVMILMDVSASGSFGSAGIEKRDLAAEIASLLAFSALSGGDRVGLLLFSSKIERFVPPGKGSNHVLMMVREILTLQAEEPGTDPRPALDFLANAFSRRCLTFFLSDFFFDCTPEAMRACSMKHDVVALQIIDPLERQLPEVGTVRLADPETGEQCEIRTSNQEVQKNYRKLTELRQQRVDAALLEVGIDKLEISTDRDYLPPLRSFLVNRSTKSKAR